MGVRFRLRQGLQQVEFAAANRLLAHLDSLTTQPALAPVPMGRHSYGAPRVLVYNNEHADVTIGAFCSIAAGVTIFAGGDHALDIISTFPLTQLFEGRETHNRGKGAVRIGNDVWVGMGATIMSGVTVGDGAVIAARSVVTRDVAPYAVVAGNPAREVKKRFTDEEIAILLELAWWTWPDERIQKALKVLTSGDVSALRSY